MSTSSFLKFSQIENLLILSSISDIYFAKFCPDGILGLELTEFDNINSYVKSFY